MTPHCHLGRQLSKYSDYLGNMVLVDTILRTSLGIEQVVVCKRFEDDAASRPQISLRVKVCSQDNFWGSVASPGDFLSFYFFLPASASKSYQFERSEAVLHHFLDKVSVVVVLLVFIFYTIRNCWLIDCTSDRFCPLKFVFRQHVLRRQRFWSVVIK